MAFENFKNLNTVPENAEEGMCTLMTEHAVLIRDKDRLIEEAVKVLVPTDHKCPQEVAEMLAVKSNKTAHKLEPRYIAPTGRTVIAELHIIYRWHVKEQVTPDDGSVDIEEYSKF